MEVSLVIVLLLLPDEDPISVLTLENGVSELATEQDSSFELWKPLVA